MKPDLRLVTIAAFCSLGLATLWIVLGHRLQTQDGLTVSATATIEGEHDLSLSRDLGECATTEQRSPLISSSSAIATLDAPAVSVHPESVSAFERLLTLYRSGQRTSRAFHEAGKALTATLRRDPKEVDVLAERVRDPRLESEFLVFAMEYVGQVGTPAVGAFVAHLLDEPGQDPGRGALAATALFHDRRLGRGTQEVLLGLLDDARWSQPFTGFRRDLLRALAIHSTGGQLGARESEALLALEPKVTQEGCLAIWLTCLDVKADAGAAEVVHRHLYHADASVRSSAIEAACQTNWRGKADVLAGIVVQDSDIGVRCAATRALADCEGALALSTTIDLARQAPEALVRITALTALAKRAEPRSEVVDVLRWAIEHDPDPEVQERAETALLRL